MSQQAIDRILKEREKQGAASPSEETSKFYSALSGEGVHEHFLELRFRDGLQTCFSYSDLVWFSHDPESGSLDLEFGGFLVTIRGRGLGSQFFHHIKSKRVAWVKEADSDFEDNDSVETYIAGITITPPEGFTEEEQAS